ncbi:MAG: SxtJ family membrane protein [Gemmatimonadota bacterium]|nr:SxtJ family membrane protein [Gemmatimonadota bacterium]
MTELPTGPRTRAELRKFGLSVGTAFGVLAGIFAWRGHETPAIVLGAVAGFLVVGGALGPGLLGPVEKAWMAMARAISKVTTPLFLGIVYFLVLAPVGIVRRTLGSHPLRHTPENDSYWADRGDSVASDLERQF